MFLLLLLLVLPWFRETTGMRGVVSDQISERRVVEDAGGRVTNIEKHLIKGAVQQIAVNEFAQLFGVAERGEWAVDEANDLAEMDVGGFAAQLVATLGAAHALHHAGILEFEQDQFQELLGENLFVGDVADLDGALVMMAGKHHHGLQGVESFLRDLHGRILSNTIELIDIIDVDENASRGPSGGEKRRESGPCIQYFTEQWKRFEGAMCIGLQLRDGKVPRQRCQDSHVLAHCTEPEA